MKILLCEDVKGLGWLGDVVDVNTGYARNYLLPYGFALSPTESNLRSLAEAKAKRAEQRLHEQKRIEQAAAAVEGAEAVIAGKANEQGQLFGSVTAGAIAQNLRDQGFSVADEVVSLEHSIKQTGTFNVTLKFIGGLTSSVTVTVVPESDESEQLNESS